MILEGKDLIERRRIAKAYPVLIAAKQGTGKTAAMEFLSDEDKKRTVYINFENKSLPNDFGDEYRTIYMVKPSTMSASERVGNYKDYDNVKYKTLDELKLLMKKIFAHKDIDRVVLDSTTSLHEQIERHYVTTSKGFTVWTQYAQEILEWLSIIKEETMVNGKFCYVIGHQLPAKNANIKDEEEPYIQIKGNTFPRGVYEGNFNTVLTIIDHKFVADNDDSYNPTKIHKSLNPYESEENSMAELEETLGSLYVKKDSK